jgi:hypothetical protein
MSWQLLTFFAIEPSYPADSPALSCTMKTNDPFDSALIVGIAIMVITMAALMAFLLLS